MTRKSIEWLDSESLPWTKIQEGVYERVLSRDEETKALTRLVKFDPGASMRDIISHEFCEEFVVFEGSLTDITLNKTFTRGTYAFRAPGQKHGPFKSEKGCFAVEIRYFASGSRA
jgi:quercetin dioxygenase-like cupin family protein